MYVYDFSQACSGPFEFPTFLCCTLKMGAALKSWEWTRMNFHKLANSLQHGVFFFMGIDL